MYKSREETCWAYAKKGDIWTQSNSDPLWTRDEQLLQGNRRSNLKKQTNSKNTQVSAGILAIPE